MKYFIHAFFNYIYCLSLFQLILKHLVLGINCTPSGNLMLYFISIIVDNKSFSQVWKLCKNNVENFLPYNGRFEDLGYIHYGYKSKHSYCRFIDLY